MQKIIQFIKTRCPVLKKCVLETIVGAIVLSLVSSFLYDFIKPKDSTVEQEHNKTRKQSSEDTQRLEKLIKELHIYGNKEKFLHEFFGDDWQQALENPQTYHNLKQQLSIHQGNFQKLIEEKKELLQKIASRRLNDKVQKLIDKAFAELRFEDVRELLDTFIENNRDTEQDLINAHYQKALSYMQEIKYREAKEEYETYIPIGIKDTDILHDYGTMYFKLGEYDKYLEVNTKRLAILLETSDKNTSEVATAYNEIGLAWQSKGEYDKAIEFYTKALNIILATLGENHPSTATSYHNISRLYYQMENYSQAQKYLQKAVVIGELMLPANHPDLLNSKYGIGTDSSQTQ